MAALMQMKRGYKQDNKGTKCDCCIAAGLERNKYDGSSRRRTMGHDDINAHSDGDSISSTIMNCFLHLAFFKHVGIFFFHGGPF
jgi:hypothetical protein